MDMSGAASLLDRPPVDYMGPPYKTEAEFEPHGPGGAGERRMPPRRDYPALRHEGIDMRYPARTFEESLQEFEPAGPGGGREPYDKVAITGILEAINNPRGGRQNLMLPKELKGMEDFELQDLMETIRRNRGSKSSKIKRGPRVSDPRAGSYQQGGLISLAPGGRTRLPMKAAPYANVVENENENENVDVDETVFSGQSSTKPSTKAYILEQIGSGRGDMKKALDAYLQPTPEETAHRELLKKRMTGLQDKQAQRVEEHKQGYWDALLEGSLRLMSEHSPEKGFLGNVGSAFSGAPKALAGVRKNIRDTKDAIEATELELAGINANLTGQERKDALRVALKNREFLYDELGIMTDIAVAEEESSALGPNFVGTPGVPGKVMIESLTQEGFLRPTPKERIQIEGLLNAVNMEVMEKANIEFRGDQTVLSETINARINKLFRERLKEWMPEYWRRNQQAKDADHRGKDAEGEEAITTTEGELKRQEELNKINKQQNPKNRAEG